MNGSDSGFRRTLNFVVYEKNLSFFLEFFSRKLLNLGTEKGPYIHNLRFWKLKWNEKILYIKRNKIVESQFDGRASEPDPAIYTCN